jgi:uncharacterized protein YbaP (TraB family)
MSAVRRWGKCKAVAAWLLAAWCWAPLAQAQTPEPATCPPSAPVPSPALLQVARQQLADRGFLWRISRDGRDSFLYGTLHAGRPEWLLPGPRTEAALHRTGALALEVNPLDPVVREQVMAVAQRPGFALSAATQSALVSAWVAECLDAAELQSGPPEWHALRLLVAQAQRQGLFPDFGAEAVLLMRNLRTERPVIGLETVAIQLEALLARNPSEAQRMVDEQLREHGRSGSGALLQRLAQAWAASDWDTLARYPEWCECQRTEVERADFERLLTRRHPAMADGIERHHADQAVFVAVGALHLPGEQGLLALMRAKGFVLTRVF